MALRAWEVSIDGNWSDSDNWTNGIIPINGDDVVISVEEQQITTTFDLINNYSFSDFTLNSLITDENFNIQGGFLGFTETGIFNETTTWTDGTLSGNFDNEGILLITVNPGDPIPIYFGQNLDDVPEINNGTLNNNGTIVHDKTILQYAYGSESTINNNSDGVYEFQSGYLFFTSFNNAGIFRKTTFGESRIGSSLINDGGTVDIQQGNLFLDRNYSQRAGITKLSGGSLSAPTAGFSFTGGTLSGNGSILGNIFASGDTKIEPGNAGSAGVLSLGLTFAYGGVYTDTETVTINIDIGGTIRGSEYDAFLIPREANLNGTLNVNLINDFIPSVGDVFEVINFDSCACGGIPNYVGLGENNLSFSGLEIAPGLVLEPEFDEDSLNLKVVSDVPAGITVTPTSGLTTSENGDTAEFTVVLNAQPDGDVEIPLSSDNTNEGTIATTDLTFTPENWDTPQTVTVTGVDDVVVDGDIDYEILLDTAISFFDSEYDGLDPDNISITNLDNDTETIDEKISGNNQANELDGGVGNDTIVGRGGDDTLTGGEGDDLIKGGYGNDVLEGGADNDKLRGGQGNDFIRGGLGNDTLFGEAGSDLFVIAPGEGINRIRDFNLSQGDRIGLADGLTLDDIDTRSNKIFSNGETLAIVTGVQTNTLRDTDFVILDS